MAARSEGERAARRPTYARVRMPFRQRLVARTRLVAFAGILVVVALALGLSGVVAASLGTPVAVLFSVQAVAFFLLVALAWVFARRSSLVVEELFQQEDRIMLAVVHEINRPLSRLVASADEGLSGATAPEVALEDVSVHTDTLRSLIEALLESARVATGAVPLPHESVRLDQVAAQIETTEASGPATIALDADPVVVIGSSRLLRLAMMNLVRNAAQHAYRGGPGEIGLRVDRRGVTVVDDGPGIEDAQLAELRSRESWVGLRTAHIGMGLAIAAWVAEVHGGTLLLDNRYTGGLEVRLAIPTQPVISGGAPRPRGLR